MRKLVPLLAVAIILAPSTGGCSMVISDHNDTRSYTPLMAAAEACDLEDAQKAFQNDPSQINTQDSDMNNATALHDTAEQDCTTVGQYLLDNGAQADATETDGTTPLHLAARNGNIELIKSLLKAGANINALDSRGLTPLDRAENRGHTAAADLLRQQNVHEGK